MTIMFNFYNDFVYLFIGIVVILLWNYVRWLCTHFERNDVCILAYSVPFIGHMWKNILQREHMKDLVDRLYKAFPGEKYAGVQQLTTPMIMIKDLDLIKQVAIKDFDHFQDRVSHIDESVDPILGAILVALEGQKWRDMRATLSPVFTSLKMRGMFEFVEECAQQMVNHLDNEMKMAKDAILEIELKNIFNRYTNDVIASTAFGLKINSFQHVNNTFYTMGKETIDFSGFKLIKFLFAASSPKIFNILGLSVADKSVNKFYRSLVENTMNERKKKKLKRADMVDLLMKAKKGSLRHDTSNGVRDAGFSTAEESSIGKTRVKREWTDDQITAQAVLFLLAGFETTANLLSFLIYELTIHPDILKRLQDEIDEVLRNNNGRVTYTTLHEMVYLDMVVSETLRKWPPFVLVDRKCVKTYTLPPSDETASKGYVIQVGQGIQIPVFSIHRDPQYYPDPEKFDPERFSNERKGEINPNSYLPFGVGPRNCIGSRFALMETKVVIFYLLKKYNFIETKKTENPLILRKNTFNLTAHNGFHVALKHRE